MSENLARNDLSWDVAAPAEQPGRTRTLRAVTPGAQPAAASKPKVVYALIALGTLGMIVVVQLLLSVGLSQGAYELNALQTQHRELGWQRQAVATDLATISSPQYVAANAEALGMTFGGTPAYISLATGSILGIASGAGATGSVKQAPADSVGNRMLDGAPIVATGTGDIMGAGAAAAEAPATPVSLDTGLPSPQTH